jgi:transposase
MAGLRLTARQRERLRRQLVETRDLRTYRRTLALLEADRGRAVAAIAQMLGVSRQTVHNWLATFAQTPSPAALVDAPRSGRPRLLDEEDINLLYVLLGLSPQHFGFPEVDWTVPRLCEALERGTGRQASYATVRRQLWELNYVWKRPRYVLAPDPEREKKTADQAANPGPAQAQRGAGPGRDRPVALPAAAGAVVRTRQADRGLAQRPQRPACHLWCLEPAHGGTNLGAARARPQCRLPSVYR